MMQFAFSEDDDRGGIENKLRAKLGNIFKHFHHQFDKRAKAVDKAMESTRPLVDDAVSITAGTFSLSIEMMSTDFQGNTTVQSLLIEATVFRLEANTAEGTVVMDFSGAKIEMSQTEFEAGQAVSYYSRSAEFSTFALFAGNNESFIEAHLAIATLTEIKSRCKLIATTAISACSSSFWQRPKRGLNTPDPQHLRVGKRARANARPACVALERITKPTAHDVLAALRASGAPRMFAPVSPP